ncbi:MAG: cache domain-containing protein [Thermodesulfobacteriota bacterium]|nr:cache domain-containing protein [Thermodesulfobacteriota bacterium]
MVVSFLVGSVSLVIGGRLLYNAVLNEATNRISLDLNAAREIYNTRIDTIQVALNITTLGSGFRSAIKQQDTSELANRLKHLAEYVHLDFACVVSSENKTLCRIGPHPIPKEDSPLVNPLVFLAFKRKAPVAGTVVLSHESLSFENPELADRARIRLFPTHKAAPISEKEEISGLALAAAIPVFEGNSQLGILYGGCLLNRSKMIVDTVRDTVFQYETYKGRNIGTATIFLKDIRIATNVLTPEGKRAIGTRVSQEVKDHVLTQGRKWTDRAFVLNDWYITAYEPIKDIFGERVGMLYVGVLEAKYLNIRRKALFIFIIITMTGMMLAIGLGYILADKIMQPVHRLIEASQQVSEGNLHPEIDPLSKNEIGVLQTTFKNMLHSLEERDRQRKLESEIQILQSEKQASIGRLAAGIAHEINNPLTGVLTFTHMLLRRKDLDDEIQSDLQTIADSTERVRKIIRGLLDFSRQTELHREVTDINQLIRSSLSIVESQVLLKGLLMQFNPDEAVPMLNVDRNQIQSVILNVILNAFDATDPGGTITVSTHMSLSSAGKSSRRGIAIVVTDTGCGIPQENLDKLFDPFFTTKEVGRGTGLGLAVSLGIVQRHEGTISIQSEVGRGSIVTIWLPTEEKSEKPQDIGS